MIGKVQLAAVAMAVSGVPERMFLTNSMKTAKFGGAKLVPLSIKDQTVSEAESLTAGEVIKSHTGKHGSICFVVRRPG